MLEVSAPILHATASVLLRHASYLGRLEHLQDIRRMSLEGEVIPQLALRCEAAGGLQYGPGKPHMLTAIAVYKPTMKPLPISCLASMTCTTHA